MANTKEKIPVYIHYENGRTTCLCHRDAKGCHRKCSKETVERDKYKDWEKTMRRDRFGKCALDR